MVVEKLINTTELRMLIFSLSPNEFNLILSDCVGSYRDRLRILADYISNNPDCLIWSYTAVQKEVGEGDGLLLSVLPLYLLIAHSFYPTSIEKKGEKNKIYLDDPKVKSYLIAKARKYTPSYYMVRILI